MRGLNRDKAVEIARLTGCKNFVCKRQKFMFNAFVDLKPMQTFQNGSDTSRERFLVVHKLTGNQSLWMTNLISAVILLSNVALTYFCRLVSVIISDTTPAVRQRTATHYGAHYVQISRFSLHGACHQTVQMSKLCLCAFDNKRYILHDSIRTLACEHYSLRN